MFHPLISFFKHITLILTNLTLHNTAWHSLWTLVRCVTTQTVTSTPKGTSVEVVWKALAQDNSKDWKRQGQHGTEWTQVGYFRIPKEGLTKFHTFTALTYAWLIRSKGCL